MNRDNLLNRLTSMLADANREVNLDEENFAEIGQDTEEAENSGYLIGYAEGLRVALELLEGDD